MQEGEALHVSVSQDSSARLVGQALSEPSALHG